MDSRMSEGVLSIMKSVILNYGLAYLHPSICANNHTWVELLLSRQYTYTSGAYTVISHVIYIIQKNFLRHYTHNIARGCALNVRISNIYRHYHLLESSQKSQKDWNLWNGKLPPCQNWILARPLWWVQNRRSYLRIQISWQDDTEASLMKVSIVAASEGLTSHKKAQIWFAPLCFKSPWR